MRVLVCGSRDWDDDRAIWAVLGGYARLPHTVVIHGDARGADRMAHDIATGFGLTVERFPANWYEHGKAAGPKRNQQMLDEGKPNVVFAFKNNFNWSAVPETIPGGGGTEDMARRAKAAGIPCYVVSRV